MTARHWCIRVPIVAVVVLLATTAQAQVRRTTTAVPSTLGAIPNGTGQRLVQFDVPQQGLVLGAELTMTLTHPEVSDLTVNLTAPDGTQHSLFSWAMSPAASVSGAYNFTDAATVTFYNAASSAGSGAIPPGDYLTNNGSGGAQSMKVTFEGHASAGAWTLRLTDNRSTNGGGTISSATLTLDLGPGGSTFANSASLGAIADATAVTPLTPGPPRDVTFTVDAVAGPVRSVRVAMGLTHTYVGDLVARLIAPDGTAHVLFGYTGSLANTNAGSSRDLSGIYEFRDTASGDWWSVAGGLPFVAPGAYRTTTIGGSAGGGAVTSMDAAMAGVAASGTWTLRLTDGTDGDVGSITAARLSLSTIAAPTSRDDAASTAFGTPLNVAAPGLLGNDSDNLGGEMTASLVTAPAHGSATVARLGGFTYTPRAGFIGTDTFTYRASSSDGPGNVATVSVVVAGPTTVQAPTALRAASVNGNTVTLRWTPPVGITATDYVIDGGVTPGQVLASLASPGPLPLFTFNAPNGAFYLRVRALANGVASSVSNEIRVLVQTPAAPSAPDSLTGVVNGATVGLSWRNTFAGGAPASQQIVVTGAATAVLPLPLGETFSFAGVPGGSYTFRVRAANVTGTSSDSNAVSLTFPTSCAGAPAPPPDFLAYAVGNVVHLLWDPPAAGEAAATGYVITVGGSLNAAVPVPVRAISAPLPSGAYTFAVASRNVCGTGAATAPQTVFIP
jgi:subtilisin-like proprotein convertase family protein